MKPKRGRPTVNPGESSTDIHLTVPSSVYDHMSALAATQKTTVPDIIRKQLSEFRNPK
jgi:hypothetical protein